MRRLAVAVWGGRPAAASRYPTMRWRQPPWLTALCRGGMRRLVVHSTIVRAIIHKLYSCLCIAFGALLGPAECKPLCDGQCSLRSVFNADKELIPARKGGLLTSASVWLGATVRTPPCRFALVNDLHLCATFYRRARASTPAPRLPPTGMAVEVAVAARRPCITPPLPKMRPGTGRCTSALFLPVA